jgi:transcriptional regulator with XRE-family HTH domain
MARVSIPTNGLEIRRLRQIEGWNSTPFAKQVRISVGYLSRLESGERNASPEVLGRIAHALKVTIVDLSPARESAAIAAQ